MLISTSVLEQVLHESGINWNDAKTIVNRSKDLMCDESVKQQKYLTLIYMRAIKLRIEPDANETVSEQQAVRLLEKSRSFLKVARKQGRLTPEHIVVGNAYRYTFHNLAEYLAKKEKYKWL